MGRVLLASLVAIALGLAPVALGAYGVQRAKQDVATAEKAQARLKECMRFLISCPDVGYSVTIDNVVSW